MTMTSWKSGQSGLWTDPNAWSDGSVPGSRTQILIAAAPVIAGLPYTIALQGSAAVHAIDQTQADAVLDVSAGTLSVSGTYALTAGLLALNNATLQGGTLAGTQGTIVVAGPATLSGVAMHGTFSVQGAASGTYAQLRLLDDSFAGTGGHGAAALALGRDVAAELGANPALGNVAIALNGASLEQAGGLLTIDASAAIDASGSATLGDANALTNRGQIAVSGAGSLLTVDATTLLNQGTIAVGGGADLLVDTGTFDNTGLVAIGAGGYLRIQTAGGADFADSGRIAVAGGTLSLDTALTTAQLGALPVASGTLAISGTLDNSGAILRSGAGTGMANLLLEGGTITAGTIVNTGSFSVGVAPVSIVAPYSAPDSLLAGVAFDGVLQVAGPGAKLDVAGGLSLNGDSGSGAGTLNVGGAGASVTFLGSQTFDRAQIDLGCAAPQDYQFEQLLFEAPASGDGTLVLGTHSSITQTGLDTAISTTGYPGTIDALGTITAAYQGGMLDLTGCANAGLIAVSNGDALHLLGDTNAGTIDVSGGQLAIDGPVSNAGLISVSGAAASASVSQNLAFASLINTGVLSVSNGASASLGAAWSNGGTFAVADGVLSVGGVFTRAQLGVLQIGASGTLGLLGTLTNGGPLAIGAGTALPAVALQPGGAIQGGILADSGGGLLAQGGMLSGVAFQGVLSLAAAGAQLVLQDGSSFSGKGGSGNGSIAITGAGSSLAYRGDETLDHVSISLGSPGAGSGAGSGDGATLGASFATLTLGTMATIQQVGAAAILGAANGTVVNDGQVVASQAGATLSLLGTLGNAGSIAVNGQTLSLDLQGLTDTGRIAAVNSIVDAVQLTAAELAMVQLTGSQVDVTGTLTAAGSTLAVGAGGSIPGLTVNGTVAGGTIHDAGGAVQFVGASTLDGVRYQGMLAIGRPFATVTVTDGLTLTAAAGTQPGSLSLTGAGASLAWDSSQALDNAHIGIGAASAAYGVPAIVAAAGDAQPVLLGAHLLIQQAGAFAAIGSSAGTYTSAATLAANLAHGQFTLDGSEFTNTGTIGIAAGDTVSASAAGFTNAGLIVIGTASALDLNLYNYFASASLAAQSFTNTGSLVLAGGTLLELTGNGLFPKVPLLNAAGGRIAGAGVVASQIVNDGAVEARGGVLNLVQAVSGSGVLQVDPGATLVLGGVGSGQTVRFTGAGGVLGLQPAYFLGTIGGFAAGDTIDLFNTAGRSAAFSGDTLAITLANGSTLRLDTTAALTGALSVTHGDTLIRYAGTADPSQASQAPSHAGARLIPPIGSVEPGWTHLMHSL